MLKKQLEDIRMMILDIKLNISLKEASETEYWLELLFETDYLTEDEFTSIHTDCVELIKLLTAIIKTSFNNKLHNSQSRIMN